MKNIPVEFGKLVRKRRKLLGISQEQLAMLIEIDRSYMGRIERGQVNTTLDKLYRLAKVLECKPAELLP